MIRIDRRRVVVFVALAGLVAGPVATAAPVPKPDPKEVDRLLERVRVDNVGSSLTQPAVGKEIDLDDAQAKKLVELWDEMGNKLKAKMLAKGQGNGPEEMLGMFGAMLEFGQEFDAEVTKLLTPAQVRRLKQIQLQKEGPAALLGRHAIRALNPTAVQEDQMAAELAKCRKLPMMEEIIAMSCMEQLPQGAGGEAAALLRVLEKYAAEVDAVQQAMLKHLTKEQRETWAKMTGDPLPRLDLLRAGTAFGDARVVKVVTDAQNVGQPAPPPLAAPPVVVQAGAIMPDDVIPAPQVPACNLVPGGVVVIGAMAPTDLPFAPPVVPPGVVPVEKK